MPPRVYALCDVESVAETLAVLVGPDCDYRSIAPASLTERAPLPRPTVLIDARARHHRARDPNLGSLWPGVHTLRLNLASAMDPVAARRLIATALHDSGETAPMAEAIRTTVGTLASELKPRLIATRWLLSVARGRQGDTLPWPALLREQLVAITTRIDRFTARGRQ